MATEKLTTTMEAARRIFIWKQCLAGNSPEGTFNKKVTDIIRKTGYIQWDPVKVVAPSHLISLWSRIGSFQWSDLDKMMWTDKEAFFHWTPIAWLVLTEDYPIYYSLMKRYLDSLRRGWSSHSESAAKFMDSHMDLRKEIVKKLKEGPAATSEFRGYGKRLKSSDGWSSGSEVSRMLYHLHMIGEVMVSGHRSNQNVWALTEDFLPLRAEKTIFPAMDLEMKTAVRALGALGIASERDIFQYFVRGRYTDLKGALKQLVEDETVVNVEIEEQSLKKPLYMLSSDKRKLDSIMSEKWRPEVKLISPFDNLIILRERTKRMFKFDYILEQFVPKEKRKFGTYVLPILRDSSIVGRIDAKLDSKSKTLKINGVFAEPCYGNDELIGECLQERIIDFARFLGAEKVVYGERKPEKWAKYLT
jgi:uncharacterized protein YcaQ